MYKINFFRSKYDNEVRETYDMSWEELIGLFAVHRITEVKNDLGFIFAEFKTTDYLPATRGIYEVINGVHTEIGREVKLFNDKTIVGRYAENIIAYHCLVFDYDGEGVLLDQKRKDFAGFKHIGYTSHNHVISGVHKFRIIFPFSDPCPIKEWQRRQDAFRSFGGVDDRSTTAMARIFFAPTCPQDGSLYKEAWHSDGEILDWRLFETKVQKPITIQQTVPMSSNGPGKVRYETLDMVQFFKDQGLYQSANSNGKHEVTCFRQNEHKTNTPGGTVVWQRDNEWPSFYCGHSHSLTSKDFWAHYKKTDLSRYCLREDTPETTNRKRLNSIYNKIRKI